MKSKVFLQSWIWALKWNTATDLSLWLYKNYQPSSGEDRGTKLRATGNVRKCYLDEITMLWGWVRDFIQPLLTNSMEKSPSWEDNSCSSTTESLSILWSPTVHCCVHNRLPLVSIVSQVNPVHNPSPPPNPISNIHNNLTIGKNALCSTFKQILILVGNVAGDLWALSSDDTRRYKWRK